MVCEGRFACSGTLQGATRDFLSGIFCTCSGGSLDPFWQPLLGASESGSLGVAQALLPVLAIAAHGRAPKSFRYRGDGVQEKGAKKARR